MAITVPYLGLPGAMRALPSPNSPVDAAPSRNDVRYDLLGGGVGVSTLLNETRDYTLPYTALDEAGMDTILGFYRRLFGLGPFVFVNPADGNVLGLDVSSMGLRAQAGHGWIASSGTLTRAAGGPTGVDTGVLTWGSLSASATLLPGPAANTVDPAAAPVVLSSEAVTVSLYAKCSSTTTATLQLCGFNSAGVLAQSTLTQSMSLTTSWQRFTVTGTAGTAGLSSSVLLAPRVVLGGTVPTTVSVAAAQVEYGGAATTWTQGQGAPRVLPVAPPGRSIQQSPDFWADFTLTLAEI